MEERPYRLLYPMRVILISTADAKGRPNIMTAAWSMPVSADPPLFAITVGKARYSHKLISETKEFVINLPDEGMEEALLTCGTLSGKDVDKFAKAGLTQEKASKIKAPLIKECYVSIECKLFKAFDAGDHTLFVGEMAALHKRKEGKGIYDKGGSNFFSF